MSSGSGTEQEIFSINKGAEERERERDSFVFMNTEPMRFVNEGRHLYERSSEKNQVLLELRLSVEPVIQPCKTYITEKVILNRWTQTLETDPCIQWKKADPQNKL